jgi:hypothetical protein
MLPSNVTSCTPALNSTQSFTPSGFAQVATNHSRVLTIIKTAPGNIFGGYVEDTLIDTNEWVEGSHLSFLFALAPLTLKLTCSSSLCVLMGPSTFGFVLGSSDLRVFSTSNGIGSAAPKDFTNVAPGYSAPDQLNCTTITGFPQTQPDRCQFDLSDPSNVAELWFCA